VVQPTDKRMRRNAADPLNRTRYRGILGQGTMASRDLIRDRDRSRFRARLRSWVAYSPARFWVDCITKLCGSNLR
jgi:hypothetical protein